MSNQNGSNQLYSQAQDLALLPQDYDRSCLRATLSKLLGITAQFVLRPVGIKHRQLSLLLWQSHGTTVGVLRIVLNSLTKLQNLVTIHGRTN